MRIDHIAIFVRDLEAEKDFFVRFFKAKPSAIYKNPKTGFCSYFLEFDDNCRLELMCRPDLDTSFRPQFHIGYAHLSFSVGSKEQVDTLTHELQQRGYHIFSEPRTTGDGYYESCILDNEGNQIEITV